MKKDNKKKMLLIGIFIAFLLFSLVFILLNNNKNYVVKFDSGSGSITQSIKVKGGEKVAIPEEPTKEGYIFVGWFYNNQLFDFNNPINSDLTLIAKWAEKPNNNETFLVVFDTGGGTQVEKQVVEKGSKVIKPGNPTKEGYTFKGWFVDNTEYDFEKEVNNNLVIVAKWEKNSTKNNKKSNSSGKTTNPSQSSEKTSNGSNTSQTSKKYTIKVALIDEYSPDRLLTVYENDSKISVKEIRYSDGVLLCKGTNLAVNKNDIAGEKELIVVLSDGKEVTATIVD